MRLALARRKKENNLPINADITGDAKRDTTGSGTLSPDQHTWWAGGCLSTAFGWECLSQSTRWLSNVELSNVELSYVELSYVELSNA